MKISIKFVNCRFGTVDRETPALNFKRSLMLPCVEGTFYLNRNSINPEVKAALSVNVINCPILTFNIFDSETELWRLLRLWGILCRLVAKNI